MISNVSCGVVNHWVTMSSGEENVATTTIGALSPVSVGRPSLQPVTGIQHRSLPPYIDFISLGENQPQAEEQTIRQKLVQWRLFVNKSMESVNDL